MYLCQRSYQFWDHSPPEFYIMPFETNTELEVFHSSDFESQDYKDVVLRDYWICEVSREASLLARKEVLNGRAKFGILGDGKEVPQVAMARAFQKGDWRSGYYRDQTFMFARGLSSVEQYFAQLYADVENDPFSGGRQMNNHFATPIIDRNGEWLDQTQLYNVSSDVSSTAGQMARGLGIALASKHYRQLENISKAPKFSNDGNEISFVTIGDSSTSEGVFWETINAAAVMKVPLLVAVWDDGYGISVPVEMQTVKSSISKALEGFLVSKNSNGIHIFTVKGWDYPNLCATFEKAAAIVREQHIPTIIHVQEVTQPQGHSTSGSHERYKSSERLNWENEYDCNSKMAEWIIKSGIADEHEVTQTKENAIEYAKNAKNNAWKTYSDNISPFKRRLDEIYNNIPSALMTDAIQHLHKDLKSNPNPIFAEITSNARRLAHQLKRFQQIDTHDVDALATEMQTIGKQRYDSELYSSNKYSALQVTPSAVQYEADAPMLSGYQILNTYFDHILSMHPNIIAFGEDVGQIGDVNQGFAGLQEKYSEDRVYDTGIREWTIMGQAIGCAMRGLRPIAEIQYLDYLAYAFSALSDDLATLRYRSNGIQRAPAIIRTRGHRLEGIWHAGSPMGMLLNSMKGIYLCVPRNMTQAVGFYNTMLRSDDPAIIVECLNGYRLKEKLPMNIYDFCLPLGIPEVLREGKDITVVTYGSCVREAQKACDLLLGFDIHVELIDAQTLMPFDIQGMIVESLKKTNKIIFMDEDLPSGATSFMMREVLEKWDGYKYLDAKPRILSASEHRTPFGSDGDYFTKPYAEDLFDLVLEVLSE